MCSSDLVNDSVASEWGPQFVGFVRTIANAVKRLEAKHHGQAGS